MKLTKAQERVADALAGCKPILGVTDPLVGIAWFETTRAVADALFKRGTNSWYAFCDRALYFC